MRRSAVAFLAAGAAILWGEALASPALREYEPVIVEGARLSEWAGDEDLTRIGLFRYETAAGTFVPIPFQIDKRRKIYVNRNMPQGVPASFVDVCEYGYFREKRVAAGSVDDRFASSVLAATDEVARFYGITVRVTSTQFVEFADTRGFEAKAEAVRNDGHVISCAESLCMQDEPNWKGKPLFQLKSMAQTRACAKALRNVLAWVVVLAGYAPTPSEEMTHVERIPTKAEKTVGQLENELKVAMESECFNAEQRKKVAGWLKKKPGYDKIKEQLAKCLEQVRAWGLVDLYRKHHPSENQFTFWDYRLPMSFRRDLGWRLDHIWVTERMAEASVDCSVDTQPRGLDRPTDHTPVWAVFNLSHLRTGA